MGKWCKILEVILFPITLIVLILKMILKSLERKNNRIYIQKIDIQKIDNLSGDEFEDFLFYVISDCGLRVTKTKKSKDYGADLIVEMHNIKIAIQCKLYFRHTVGNSAVQEIVSAMDYYNCNRGLVITNSFYSHSAIKLSEATKVNLMNRELLIQFLSSTNSQKISYFNSLITKDKPTDKSNKIKNNLFSLYRQKN